MTAAATRLRKSAPEQPPATFGPGTSLWDDMGNTLFLSMTAGAFMLQAMHPTISAAVDRHSVFRTDPGGRAVRSLDSMMLWVYGGPAAIEEGERLRVLHRPIHGTTDDGEHYSALDPDAYAWVHGTAFATSACVYPYVQGRELRGAEAERVYEETLQLGRILQVPERLLPPTVSDYWDYYETMVRERLTKTKVARELMVSIEHPRVRVAPGPIDPLGRLASVGAGRVLWLLTYGGMTASAREILGVRWSPLDDAALRALMTVARPVHDRLPERYRYVPLALHARRHARELEKIRGRATRSVA